jgi:hypothetical protein
MTITIEAYEDWGPAIGSPVKGTTRTEVTNFNLKAISAPAQNYYLNDIQRPNANLFGSHGYCSFKRYFSFKIYGTYNRVKNSRIIIPSGFVSNNWRVMYKMTNLYEQPTGTANEFGRVMGDFDGSLLTLTEETTIFPLLSTVGPEAATSRAISYGPNQTLWTQYLVMQFMCHSSDFDDVDNEGTGTVKLILDELE